MARRSKKGLGSVDIELDMERVAEMRERPEFYRKGADKLVEAACRISQRGEAWGFSKRKVFLSDLSKEVGIPMHRLAPLVVPAHNLGWLNLARADLVGAMDPKKVEDSEIVVGRSKSNPYGQASFHFIEIEPKSCFISKPLKGMIKRKKRR